MVSLGGSRFAMGRCPTQLYGSSNALTMQEAMKIDISELNKAEAFGALMAVFLWIYGFMSPISGMIADRLNRK